MDPSITYDCRCSRTSTNVMQTMLCAGNPGDIKAMAAASCKQNVAEKRRGSPRSFRVHRHGPRSR